MKVEIPQEDDIKTIDYMGKVFRVAPLMLRDFSTIASIQGENFNDFGKIVDFLCDRLPEADRSFVEAIPAHHIDPILKAITKVYEIPKKDTEKKSS